MSLGFSLSMCGTSDTGTSGDSDNGADGDADTDADGDGDGDADTDADGDADTDADGDADSDTDSDADGDADTDTDTDADGDADTDTDTDADSTCPNTCVETGQCAVLGGRFVGGYTCPSETPICCDLGTTDGDADTDTDGDADTDTDGDADTDTDGDTDTDADGDTDGDTDTDTDADADSDSDGDTYDTTQENSGESCNATAGNTIPSTHMLPDPFAMHDGTRIASMSEWRCRRAEILEDLQKYEIGEKPDPSTCDVSASYSGSTLTVTVTTSAGSMKITSTVSGASPGSPKCVVIGMNSNSSLISGCIQVPFKHNDVVTYNSTSQNDGFYKVYPDLWKVGDYAAWSWGISRLIDGIAQVADDIGADMTKIAVHGCSYAGKMALFGGALDERVALTVAQESGGGGITSWRLSQDFTDRTGTNVEKIDNTNNSWFLSSMLRLDEYTLPHDHHELIALIAPRAVIALGNPGYEWLSDESGYKSINAAAEVWKAMGIDDRIGWDFTGGHSHCGAPDSQKQATAAFADKFLKDNSSANTDVDVPPASSYGFNLDWEASIDWTTPSIPYTP